MKIPSKGSAGDVMSMGANAVEKSKDTSFVPDFKSYMQQSAVKKEPAASDMQNISKGQDVQTEKSKGVDTGRPKDDRKVNDEQTKCDAEPSKQDTAKVSDKGKAEEVSAKDEASVTDEVSGVDEEISQDVFAETAVILAAALPMTQVMELLNQIQTEIQELLGIGTEQFNQILDSLGMQLSDILDGGNRQQFFLAAENAQPLDLLTDEQLAGMLSQMNSMIEEAVAVSDIEAGTLQAAIEQMQEFNNADPEEDVAAEPGVQAEETMESAEGSHIRFSVELEGGQERSSDTFRGEQQNLSAMKEQVLAQLNQAVGQMSEAQEVNEAVTPAEIVHQVVEEIKLVARQDTTSMELQLYPEHLGKVAIQVSSRNGAVTAQITAENEMARAALENSIQTLKETFQNQGLKVEAVEVMVATSAFSQEQFMDRQTNQEESKSGKDARRLNLDDLEGLDEEDLLTEEEQLNVEMMRREGRNVDYTA